MPPPNQGEFDVYGFAFRLCGQAEAAIRDLASDFQFFRRAAVSDPVTVELICSDPPYDEVPEREASIYTPRNISFADGESIYVDYSGRGLGIWDRGQRRLRVYTRDPHLHYEVAYLFLLSQVGEALDQRGMHRLHAMAMAYQGRSVLAILPMGGGKSTLAASLLRYREFDFLSDDSPIVSRDGTVHAFPLRLGLLPGTEQEIPPDRLRVIQRMEFGPKVLVNYEYFADRVKASAEPGIVFLGRRSLSRECRIEPAGRGESYRSIVANCAVGLGLFQGLEFVLTQGPLAVASKAGVAWSRFLAARRLFAKSEVYRLVLGRDSERNADTVRQFVHERLG